MRINFLVIALLAVLTAMAGNVKVLKTEPTGVDFDMQSMFVTVNVQIQAANVAEGQCGILVLINNARWKDSGLTFEKFVKLCEKTCFGDADIAATGASTTHTVPVAIPIERQLMTGKSDTLFLKAYVVDGDSKSIIAQGQMVTYHPDQQALRQQMMQRGTSIAGAFLGAIMSGAGSGGGGAIPDGNKQCSSCSGSGKCSQCMGRGSYNDEKCSWCHDGRCQKCGGKGYVGKDAFELMMEDDKKGKQQKGKSDDDDDDGGGLLDLLGW